MNPMHCSIGLTAAAVFNLLAWSLLTQNEARAASAGNVAGASAQLSSTSRDYEQAMAKLVTVRQAAMKVVSDNPEYRAAQERLKAAHAAYGASQKKAADGLLASSQSYKTLLEQRQATFKELEDLRASGGGTMERFSELATRKLALTQQINQMEEQARQDQGVTDLKQRWQEACDAMEILDIKTIAECEKLPQVAAAREAAEASEAAMHQAGTQLADARASYNEERRLEYKADYEQRRQEVINWNTTRYFLNRGYYYPYYYPRYSW